MKKRSTEGGMTNNLNVSHIQDRDQLVELEVEWDRLLKRTDVASPFLTPGWQMAWLDTYGAMHRPFVLTARLSGELVGLWPLAFNRRGPFKVLEPIGAGRSDWLDIPVLNDKRETVISAFLQYLAGCRNSWDIIEHRDVLSESPSFSMLESLCSSGPICFRKDLRTAAPYLRIKGTWDEFLRSKRAKFRSNLRYYRRLPERDGQLLVTHRLSLKEGDEAIDNIADVELRSWKARRGNLKVSTPIGKKFYRLFCKYFCRQGLLDVWTASIDGTPIAFVVNIIYGGKCYHYFTCYDEKFRNISPGVLLHAEAIENAFHQNLSEYDFLSGDEPYKERWCSDRRDIYHLIFFHRHPVSHAAYYFLGKARWAMRRSELIRIARQWLLSKARRSKWKGAVGDG